MVLRIAMVQDNPVVGDIDGNLEKVYKALDQHGDADLLVFSEGFVSGYPLGDLVMRPGFIALVEEGIERLREVVCAKAGPAVLIGAPVGGAVLPFNAALLIEPSGVMRTVYKTELPNSDVFDERRTFAQSLNLRPEPLLFRGFRLGVLICEDMWHGPVCRSLADEMADVLLVLNGSPYQGGKQAVRLSHARRRVRDTQLPLLYCNQVGGQDELVFDGASFVLNTDGALRQARAFEPDVMRVVLQHREGAVHIEGDSFYDFEEFPYPEDTIESDYLACVLGLRDYIEKTGSPRVYLGISGGLDSALVATMAVDAIGSDRVVGVMMPSRFTGDESQSLADELFARLSITRMILPIGVMHERIYEDLSASVKHLADDMQVDMNLSIMDENIQARLRGLSLMALTNALGGILLSTGNKSEMAVGYATLYGDMNGGFNPIKSIYKSDAFAMCRWRNKTTKFSVRSPIPLGIIERPPSAELAEGQTDEKSLGTYPVLDFVLRALIEEKQPISSVVVNTAQFFGEAVLSDIPDESLDIYVARIAGLVRRAQYKRHQSPPGVKVHGTDFGLGWRYPIAGKYGL